MNYQGTIVALEEEIRTRQEAIESLKKLNGKNGHSIPEAKKSVTRTIVSVLKDSSPLSSGMLYSRVRNNGINCKKSTVQVTCSKLVQKGELRRVSPGVFSLN